MNLSVISILPKAFSVTALAFWGVQWRQTRKTGVAAMCAALICLLVAQVLGDLISPIYAVLHVPSLAHLLEHAAALSSAYWLRIFCLHLRYAEPEIAPRQRIRARQLQVALLGLVAFWALGPLSSGLPEISPNYGYPPLVQCYLLVFLTFLGLAMVDIYLSSRQARHVPRRWLRIGLRLLGTGSLFGLVYVAWRLAYSVSSTVGISLPLPDTDPDVTGPIDGVCTYAAFIAVCLMTAGIMVPPLGTRWDARKAARQLRPLWTAMTAEVPELAFPQRRGTRLRAYVTEIRDILIGPLKPYLDANIGARARHLAQTAGLDRQAEEAAAEAAMIAAALRAHHHHRSPARTSPMIAIPDALDESADVDRLVRIATAFTTSDIVAAVLEETDLDPAR